MVTLKTFDNFVDAHLLKSKLESEGITCYLFDENIVAINPLLNLTVGGIKLNISDSDVEKAREILIEIQNTSITDENDKQIICPKCGSADLYTNFKSTKGAAGIIASLCSILLSVFPFYYKSVYKCKSCGEEFKSAD